MTPELLDARNSGDTAGGQDRVVGYASFAFWDERLEYGGEHGRTLLGLARASVANALQASAETSIPDVPWLKERRATFVTLMQDAKLRGCIGSLQPTRALGDDVVANAAAAALADRRFSPLGRDDLARVEMEVSLLSAPTAVLFADEGELLAALRPSFDGVILASGDRRGTYRRRSGARSRSRARSSRSSCRRPGSRPTPGSRAARCGGTRCASGRNRS
jgi:AmmeMemoRadiSam system protein A